MTEPQIHIRKDGPFYRVKVAPDSVATPWFNKPATYTAHNLAADTARLLSDMTGWPITDHTKAK